MKAELTGRALAEAAAKAMGVEYRADVTDVCIWWRCGKARGWLPFYPDADLRADYECLEWARKNWRDVQSTKTGRAWVQFQNALQRECPRIWDYKVGAYARALVAAAKVSKETKP